MSKLIDFWKSCNSNEKSSFIIVGLFIGWFAALQGISMFNPTFRCNAAQSELQDAQKNETYERKQSSAGKRASAGIAITDAMERTARAVSKANRECKE